jgi:hypothetical protein
MSDLAGYAVNYVAADPFINAATYAHASLKWQPINDEDPSQDGWEHRVDQIQFFEYP